MEVEESVKEVFSTTHGLNIYHWRLYLLMRKLSREGTRNFMLRSWLAAKYFDQRADRMRHRKNRLVKLGLVEIAEHDRYGCPIYRVPVPFKPQNGGG